MRLEEQRFPHVPETKFQISVKSEPGIAALASAHTLPTAWATTALVPALATESRNSATSLFINCVRKPASKLPVTTRLGNLSADAVLRPLDTLITSSITCMSSPAAAPKATASEVAASATAE